MYQHRRWLLNLFVAGIAVFLIAPSLIVIFVSFSSGKLLAFPPPGFSTAWYENFFQTETWTSGAFTSLKVALGATVAATILGTLTALGLVRGEYPGRWIISALVVSPLVVPPVIIGIGMFMTYLRFGLLGNVRGLIVAHTALAIPFVVVNVATSLRTMDRHVERAAQSLGANPVRTFFRVTLPIISPGVLAGAVFAFVTSWDEVVIAIFLTSPLVKTLPVVMWSQVRTTVDPTIAAASSMLTVVTIVTLFAILLARRLALARSSQRVA